MISGQAVDGIYKVSLNDSPGAQKIVYIAVDKLHLLLADSTQQRQYEQEFNNISENRLKDVYDRDQWRAARIYKYSAWSTTDLHDKVGCEIFEEFLLDDGSALIYKGLIVFVIFVTT